MEWLGSYHDCHADRNHYNSVAQAVRLLLRGNREILPSKRFRDSNLAAFFCLCSKKEKPRRGSQPLAGNPLGN